MFEKFKERLTDDAKYWYKLWSSWLAMIWGAGVYFFWEDPSLANDVYSAIPQPYRGHVGMPLAVFAAALPILVRCLKQGKLQKKCDDPPAQS